MAPFRPSAGPTTAQRKTEPNPDRIALSKKAAHALKRCLEKNIRPLDIVTEQALVNAFMLDMAMGGSTNTILHTLALAHSAGIPFDLDRLNEISAKHAEHLQGLAQPPRSARRARPSRGGIPAILEGDQPPRRART